MAVVLPTVPQPFVDPQTGRIDRVWYQALLGLNNQVQTQVVTQVNISGNNGIVATGGPITSNGVFSLFIGNLTCANARIAGTVTASDVVATASILAANIRATGTITGVNVIATTARSGTVTSGTVDAGSVTAASVLLTGALQLGNAFTPGITGAAGWLTVVDSTGTTYKLLAQL